MFYDFQRTSHKLQFYIMRREFQLAYSRAESFNWGTSGLPKLGRFERAKGIIVSCGGSGLEDLNVQPNGISSFFACKLRVVDSRCAVMTFLRRLSMYDFL